MRSGPGGRRSSSAENYPALSAPLSRQGTRCGKPDASNSPRRGKKGPDAVPEAWDRTPTMAGGTSPAAPACSHAHGEKDMPRLGPGQGCTERELGILKVNANPAPQETLTKGPRRVKGINVNAAPSRQ